MNSKVGTKIKNLELIEKNRKKIIESAKKLFIVNGFHKTKTSEIAKESGLTEGTLYNYIRKKEDILFLLHEDLQKKVIDQINKGIQQGSDIHSRTEYVFNNFLDVIQENLETARLIYIETASQTRISLKVLLSRESEIIKKICDLITIGARQKIFNVEHPRLAASIIHFLLFYQSLNNWDIKRIDMPGFDVKKYLLFCIYRILGYSAGIEQTINAKLQ